MSNGTRLMALVVVVVLAAVGLYYAFLYNPNGPTVPVPVNTALPDGTLTAPAPPAGGLNESRVGTVGGEAVRPVTPPPAGAFNAPNLNATSPNAAKTPAGGSPSGANGATGVGANGAPGAGGAPGSSGHSLTGGPTPVGANGPGTNGTGGTGAASGNPMGSSTATGATEYAIQSGDTFESLARRFLGDGTKSRLIQDANPGVVSTNLQIGQKIRIPAAGAVSTSTPSNSEIHGANTYTVQKGDSLIAIARKVYGSEADWKRILEANSQTLKGNAEGLQPGMKLTIPAKR